MKQIIAALVIACSLQIDAYAQDAIPLKTSSVGKLRTVIIPTYDNLYKLLRASSGQWDASMKRYGYVPDSASPGSYKVAGSTDIHAIVRKESEIIYKSSVTTSYLEAMEADVLKRFPDTDIAADKDGNKVYTITVSDVHGVHHYQVRIGTGLDNEGEFASIAVVD